MDEFLQSIAKGIKERLGSAFLFNFILSWIVFNWEFVYITLFVNENNLVPFNKFDTLYDTVFIIWPAIISAILITLITPIISSIIQLYKYRIVKWRNNTELNIDGGTPYTGKEFAKLKTSYHTLETKYIKGINESENEKLEIEKLKLVAREKIELSEQIVDLIRKNELLDAANKNANSREKGLEESLANCEFELIKLEKFKNFGFFENVDANSTFKIYLNLVQDIDPYKLVKNDKKYDSIGEITFDLNNQTVRILNIEYRVLKYYSSNVFISFFVTENDERYYHYSITKIHPNYSILTQQKFGEIKIYNYLISGGTYN